MKHFDNNNNDKKMFSGIIIDTRGKPINTIYPKKSNP